HRQTRLRADLPGRVGGERLRTVRDLAREEAASERRVARGYPERGAYCRHDSRGRGGPGIRAEPEGGVCPRRARCVIEPSAVSLPDGRYWGARTTGRLSFFRCRAGFPALLP